MEGDPEDRHVVFARRCMAPTGVLRELDAINAVLGFWCLRQRSGGGNLLRRQICRLLPRPGYTTIAVTGAVGKHSDPVV